MIAALLIKIAQWPCWPDGPWQWAQPEETKPKENRKDKRAKKTAESPDEEVMVAYELHMGTNTLRDPRGVFRNLPDSGLIFRNIKPMHLSPEQGDSFMQAVMCIPDMQKALITMATMLEVSSRLLAQVDTSPGKDWNLEVNAIRAQIREFNEESPVAIVEAPSQLVT